jgi:hypothetical protein
MPAAVPIAPQALLDHALQLATHQSGAGRPRAIWLRRAVSAAYYASFHALSLAIVRQLAPNSTPDDQYRLCRSLDHARVADVCAWVRGQPGTGKQQVQSIVTNLQGSSDIKQLALIISTLQEQRHRADYDHLASFDKASTLGYVSQGQRAINLLTVVPETPDGELFLALVALHTQLR